MPKQPGEFLRHIEHECRFILNATQGLTKELFLQDEVMKRAVVRSLEIIGEAGKNISADDRLKWPRINWKNMAGMRDRLIHDYAGVNYNIVWEVVKIKIPELENQITTALNNIETGVFYDRA